MIDAAARYNAGRWQALAEAGALWTRPWLDLNAGLARQRLDPHGRLGDVRGCAVLCLAGGGGQQSAAFALLGARVTVLDLSEAQLARDREAAAHYGQTVETVPGDMRDLSALAGRAFDLVWQPYALNFVPDPERVFAQVAGVLRGGGAYCVRCANPYVLGVGPRDWNGEGYVLKPACLAAGEVEGADPDWAGTAGKPVPPPREYRHTLGALIDALIAHGFTLTGLSDAEDFDPDPQAAPGSWAHFVSVVPPWLTLRARRNAD